MNLAASGCANVVSNAYVDNVAPPNAALALGAPVPIGYLDTAVKRARLFAEDQRVTIQEREQSLHYAFSLATTQHAGNFL